MTRRNHIGGALDAEAYAALADLHRPHLAQIKAEALRLFHDGLRARDIAAALRIAEQQVQSWLAADTA